MRQADSVRSLLDELSVNEPECPVNGHSTPASEYRTDKGGWEPRFLWVLLVEEEVVVCLLEAPIRCSHHDGLPLRRLPSRAAT